MKLSTAASMLLAAECAHSFAPSFAPKRLSQHHRSSTSLRKHDSKFALWGIMDEVNSDDYNLIASSNEEEINMNDSYEMFLADMVFSANDPRVDVVNKYDQATDKDFLTWLENKTANSTNPDERFALRDLYDIIIDIKKRTELSKLAEERLAAEAGQAEDDRIAVAEQEADAGRKLSNTDVLRKAVAINSAAIEQEAESAPTKKSFFDEAITPEILMSYADQLKKFLPPYKPGDNPVSIVSKNYDKFDAQFVKVLTEKSTSGDDGASELLEALAGEQQVRISAATEKIRSLLSLGDPMRMEGALVKIAREGGVDESFLLLLEANETQARDAGATGPADLMKRLRKRAAEEKDKQVVSKEIRLIRKLLRADDSQERESILEDAFTPKENLLVAGTAENAMKAMDGEQPEQDKPMPDVPPPDFINACKAVMLNFGNLAYDDDRGDLATRIKQIASEAEVVATRIYGQGMSLRDQQDRAWKDETTSIFELEKMELQAESRGESAPWGNPNEDGDSLLPGFDMDGKMQVGGK